jgi:hypothetical protein
MPIKTSPQFKVITYQYNDESGYFDRVTCEPGFEKLPLELKIEDTVRKDIIQSSQIIRGRVKNGKYLFFTGLIPTEFTGYYFGDHYEYTPDGKKNSFILFEFSNNNRNLNAFFYNHFKIYPGKRIKFIREQVVQIKKGGESRPPSVQNHFTGQLFQ